MLPSEKPDYPPLLEGGLHVLTWAQLRELCVERFSTSLSRRYIMEGLEEVVRRLQTAGVMGEVWVNGSFLTEKVDPKDVDYLIRVSADAYDSNATVRAAVDWATSDELVASRCCDGYKWIEYPAGHPLFSESEESRVYWTGFFGTSRGGQAKGIACIPIPVVP